PGPARGARRARSGRRARRPGRPPPPRPGRRARAWRPAVATLVREPIDTAATAAAAARPDCGAVAVFLGTSRDHNEGRRVLRLEYEAYERMAIAALERIEREVVERFAVASCAITHRLGEVPIAQASVVITVAAAHRAPAFDACRWAIEELKRSVPIWKKEFFADGKAQWVEGTTLTAEQSPPSAS